MKNEEFEAKMAKEAKIAIQMAVDLYAIDISLPGKEINNVELLLSQVEFSDENPVERQGLVVFLGAFIGEVIKKEFNGKWIIHEYNGDQVPAVKIEGFQEIVLFPHFKINSRLEKGEEENLVIYYQGLKDIFNGKVFPKPIIN